MAMVVLDPIFIKISGHLYGVVFYYRYDKQCVRVYVIPRNPDTGEQRKVRHTFAGAVKSWQAMTPDEKYKYNRKARYLNMSGYNLFISGYMKERKSAAGEPVVALKYSGNLLRFHSVSYSNINQFARMSSNIGLNSLLQCQYSPE